MSAQPQQQRRALSETQMVLTEFFCPDHPIPGPGGQEVIPLTFVAGDARVTVIVPAENADAVADAIKRARIGVAASGIEQAGNLQGALDRMRGGR